MNLTVMVRPLVRPFKGKSELNIVLCRFSNAMTPIVRDGRLEISNLDGVIATFNKGVWRGWCEDSNFQWESRSDAE